MGACAGKNKSKSDEHSSNSTKKPELKIKDDHLQQNISPPILKNLPSTNGCTVNNDDNNNNNHASNTKENSVDSDIQVIIREQNEISNVLGQGNSAGIISTTDSELEYDLAKLVYGHPENDYAENPIAVTTFKSTDV